MAKIIEAWYQHGYTFVIDANGGEEQLTLILNMTDDNRCSFVAVAASVSGACSGVVTSVLCMLHTVNQAVSVGSIELTVMACLGEWAEPLTSQESVTPELVSALRVWVGEFS